MAKRKRTTTEKTIEKWLREDRGQGRGKDYIPWLSIQDVPSQGLATRKKGWKTQRVHHLMSNLELDYFYILEWSLAVHDIREQYPLLPLEETLLIAEHLGISHPKDPKTQEPIVMTTDFLITVRQKIGTIEQARTIKPAQELQSQRTLEKLEIERCYWQERSIDWGIVTEREIPKILAKNVAWLHPRFSVEDLSPLSKNDIERIARALNLSIFKYHAPLSDITSECDIQLGLNPGTSLSVVRHLIANRQWLVDLNQPIQPSEILHLLAKPAIESYYEAGGTR
ncbi:MAG TPA: TnsA endonuclease N-terminal domain-containing protein [Oculatellaceae cyanobacterium]|jgi:hypothetical protein